MNDMWRWLILGIALMLGSSILFGCFHKGELNRIDWNHNSDAKVVEVTFCCGFVPYLYVLNYIPEAQIWGDGRIVWSQVDDNGMRKVRQARLTTAELTELLEEILSAGFLDWDERYEDLNVADASDRCIKLTLSSIAKQVCEYVKGAPEAFSGLFEKLAGGAGKTGQDYIPSRGYLIAHPVQRDANEITVDMDWPSDAGFSLGEAVSGQWIEDALLQTVWELINGRPWANIVREGENIYELSLQIPDLVKIEGD